MTIFKAALLVLAILAFVALFFMERASRRAASAKRAHSPLQAAIIDASFEYQTCMQMGYTARAARSHVRAYVARNYTFVCADERMHIFRAAIQDAQFRINEKENARTICGNDLIKAI